MSQWARASRVPRDRPGFETAIHASWSRFSLAVFLRTFRRSAWNLRVEPARFESQRRPPCPRVRANFLRRRIPPARTALEAFEVHARSDRCKLAGSRPGRTVPGGRLHRWFRAKSSRASAGPAEDPRSRPFPRIPLASVRGLASFVELAQRSSGRLPSTSSLFFQAPHEPLG